MNSCLVPTYRTVTGQYLFSGNWHRHAGADALAWPTNATVSPALSLQLHCLAEPALLKALVQQALPTPSSGGTPPHTPSTQHAGTVRSLCQMLQALAGVSALCQKALIFTAGPADFVQRLWMSYLKVCTHALPGLAAEGGGGGRGEGAVSWLPSI